MDTQNLKEVLSLQKSMTPQRQKPIKVLRQYVDLLTIAIKKQHGWLEKFRIYENPVECGGEVLSLIDIHEREFTYTLADSMFLNLCAQGDAVLC